MMFVGFGVVLLIGVVLGAIGGVFLYELALSELTDPLDGTGVPEGALTDEQVAQYLQRFCNEYVHAKGNVGLAVGVIRDGKRSVFGFGRTGLDNAQQVNGETVFELASVGKTFTTTVLAKRHLDGQIDWNRPLKDFLPDDVVVPSKEGREITLLHLATHSSGLPSLPPNFHEGDPLNPYKDYTVQQMYAGLGQIPLDRPPGKRYEYSNLGMGLLGHVLERQAGKSYEQTVIDDICDPLGMDSTRMTLDDALKARLATPHDAGKAVVVWEDTAMPGAGSFLSTANDMLTFLDAHLTADEGETALLGRAMAESTRKRRPAGSPSVAMGLGWHVTSENAVDIVWHNGGAGGSRSYVGFVKEPPVAVVVLSNSSNSVDDLGYKLLYLLLRRAE